jgi:hypothetical protein
MNKFHYVYITTNLINGHQYVGDRTCNCEPEKDAYLGSGKLFTKKKKEYGIQNFKKEILELFETKEKAFNAQEKYIIHYNTLIPNGYNISPKGGYGVPGSFLHEETKKKIKTSNKGKHKEQIKLNNKKYKKGKNYEEQMINTYGEEKGKIKAVEYHKKISEKTSKENNGMFGNGYLITGENNGMFGKISPMRGKQFNIEHNKKISESKIGKERNTHLCPYCNREIGDGNYERWHGENCKQK